MNDEKIDRLPRLIAILIHLQSKRMTTATMLAAKFSVGVRTIYRDMRALEDAGVPIVNEEGKGYSIMSGYKISPIMFSNDEANALISAEIIIAACKDESLIREFSSAIEKIKATIPEQLKENIEVLESKFAVARSHVQKNNKSTHLLSIQKALIEHWVIKIEYINMANERSERSLEPFAIFSNETDDWIVVAHCRLRNEFRSFLLHRIQSLIITSEKFKPHGLSFAQYRKNVLWG